MMPLSRKSPRGTPDSLPRSPVRRFLSESVWIFSACSLASVLWQFISDESAPGQKFALQTSALAICFDTALLFLLFDGMRAVYLLLASFMPVRRTIRLIVCWTFAIPLLLGGIFLDLSRFDSVYLDNDLIHLRGGSWLSDTQFRTDKLGLVYIRRDALTSTLQFEWYDSVLTSVWIPRFDRDANEALDAFVVAMAGRGIAVSDGKPPEPDRIPPFRAARPAQGR